MRQIKIEKTKNIEKLTFDIPSNNGVYLLVGANGAGKTTLLTCLDRICNPYAFATSFTSAKNANNIDQYSASSIEYITEHAHIKFRKGTRRWACTPRTNSSSLLKREFGFENTIFIKADSKRIDVPQDEIRSGNLVDVESNIIESLNVIFETTKYNNLKRLRNVNGRGRNSTYFYVLKDGRKYYSEKRFSTGELAIIRLVERLLTTSPNSLILLDEAEMALHPRIQKNLLDYLKEKVAERDLMIIIATHSVTMIKSTHRNNIMLMENDSSNNTIISTPCYPAKAIGSVDFESNIIFDTIFFVEDDMARLVLKAMLAKYADINTNIKSMMYCIIPVGGYVQTALLAKNTRHQLFDRSKVYALLDDDVFTEAIHNNTKFAQIYEQNRDFIYSLKCTPESWLIEHLENRDANLASCIRSNYRCEINTIITDERYTACCSQSPRKLCKQKMDIVLKVLEERCGNSQESILYSFVNLLIEHEMSDGLIQSTLAPLLRY